MEEECKPHEQVLPPEVQDVEEGEISDSGSASSVEEITEEDFKKQGHQPCAAVPVASADFPPKAIIVNLENINTTNNYSSNTNNNLNLKYKNNDLDNNNNNTNSINQQQTRVWTMRNVYDYYSRGGGHNLAWASWASAVKSKPSDPPKPSDEIVAIEVPKDTIKGDGSPENSGSATVADNMKVDGSLENSVSSNIDASLKLDDTLLEISGSVTSGILLREGSVESSRGENNVVNVVIEIDDEKEDGELEEGEIDLDSDVNPVENKFHTLEGKAAELELKSNSILKGLENVVDVECAEKSFQEVYSLMDDFLESLHELADGISSSKKEDLIQLLFTAVKSLQTVFPSMSEVNKEQMDKSMKRFMENLMARKHPVLSTEQLKEMEVLVSSMNPTTVSMNAKSAEMNNEMPNIDGFDNYSEYLNIDLINDPYVDAIPMEISDESGADEIFESLGVVEVSSKYKGLSLPLLDLHKDHDADDLPSPTRNASYNLPISNVLGIVGGQLKPEWPVPRISLEPEAAAVALHPYESDAVKNVSTYQQKFGRSSFLMNDELPSPTPSGDGDTAGGGDISEEISSSLRNVYALSTSSAEIPRSSSSFSTTVNYHNGQVLQSCWSSSAPVSSGQNLQPKPSTTRNRDPRLRFLNSDGATSETLLPKEPEGEPAPGLLGSRKQKTVEEPKIGQPVLKKPRHESFESGVVYSGQTVTGSSGWQNDGGTFKPMFGNDPRKPMNTGNTTGVGSSGSSITPNVVVNNNLPVAVSTPINAILQEFIINPSLLMDFYQMEQKKSAALTKSTIQLPSLISALGSVPLMSSVPPTPSVVMKGSSETSQVVTHTTPAEESGVIRMKPRDPRRILHSNITLQKAGSIDDQSLGKISTLSLPRRASFLNEQRHEDNLEKKPIPTSSGTGPDITSQFTKSLQNIADLVSVSQSTSSPLAPVSHTPTSQPAAAPAFQGRSTSSMSSDVIQTSTGLTSKEASTVSPQQQPENNWGDVEHLFDGFDDQQKAAIQRERARRMEEQRKMFAARKLCLVLDLDHTLLNSAKFDEVEPKHHEMLRKREEEDRENPQRNLFRFPHMQMWTKLRPGIWNFLERASKLYELHLYTMGNKLYATEMAKLLDPKGDLFAGRVISRGDDTDPVDGDERVPRSKDLEGVLGMESSVVIIDDSLRVWPHNKLNLIVVERYIYFPCSRRQFGLPGPSLLEIDHDERLEDGTLASSLSVIERIHSNFYSHQSLPEADVRNILASEQRKILAGCRIVFSRIIPVGDSKPHLHPLWQSAEQFGAVCTNLLDDQVTHVVAYSLGTEKVNWALSHGRFVVRPNWVEASTLLYRRANEHDFAIK